MASLLDGIDFNDKNASAKRTGLNAAAIKVSAAVAMLLLAGAFFAMQAGVIPWPFGSSNPQVAQRGGQPSEEEIRRIQQDLLEQQQEFVENGGQIGQS